MRIARNSGLAILAMILGTAFAGRQAHAQDGSLPLLGIVIDSSTLMPTPDPQWEIDFKVSLSQGCTLTPGSTLVVSGIRNADTVAQSQAEGVTLVSSPYSSWNVTSSYDSASMLSSYTYTYQGPPGGNGPAITATNSPLPLGDLYVELNVPFDPGLIPDSILTISNTTLNYTSLTTDTVTQAAERNNGTTRPSISVPEPASLLQLAIGLGLTIYWAARRRRSLMM